MVTKGTWKYTEELDANFSMISDGQSVVCGMPNPFPPGDIETYKRELAFMRTNANLIAAAPKMLEALKNVGKEVRITDSAWGYGIFIHIADWQCYYRPIINKAEGE